MNIEKIYLTWGSIETLVRNICVRLEHQNWLPNIIIGITRGGLIPGTMLSQKLNVPMTTIDVSFRDNHFFGLESSVIPNLIDRHRILIVDDINDSGKSQAWIRQDWMNTLQLVEWPIDRVKFANLIHNASSSQPSDFYGKIIDKEKDPSWVSFPWENWFEK